MERIALTLVVGTTALVIGHVWNFIGERLSRDR